MPVDVSADGRSVLVQSNLTGTMQLYRVSPEGGEPEQLTDCAEPVSGLYVPGDERILVQMDEGGNERAQLYLHGGAPASELERLVHEPEFLHTDPCFTRDGSLLAYACNRRNGTDLDVFVRPLADAGAERCVFGPGGWCQPAGFSPDRRWLAVLRLTERSGDNDLYLVELETGEVVHASPHEDEASFGAPEWLPDSSAFLFATSAGRETAAIARFELASRSWRYVVESEWDLSVHVDRTGRRALVEANEDGYSKLELRDAETLEVVAEVPLPGRGVVASPLFSHDGRQLVYHFTSPLEPGDVWLYDTVESQTVRLTRSAGAVAAEELVEPELQRVESFDGEPVPFFLYRGRAPEPAPVVLMIHGGPEAQLRPIWSPLAQYLAGHGYAVVAPNVRGSTGYGKRYEHQDDVTRRLDSVRDLVALHDWLGEHAAFDTERIVLYGGSYGGYMVLAGLAFHPERWAAGVELVGISSLVTFLENTAPWRRAAREREYGSLDRDRRFLLEASPITHVDRIAAPLFIIHGANDPRVPVGEAEQIHAALTSRGIRCELVVYPDEGHGLAKLANRLDAYPRAVAFLDEVLASPPKAT